MIYNNGITIDRANRIISHRGYSHRFDDIKRKTKNLRFELACYLILSDGASKEMAFWHLYANDPEGGPLDGPHLIHIMLNHFMKDLYRIGLAARSWKLAGVNYYEIVPHDQAMISKTFSDVRSNSRTVRPAGVPVNSGIANVAR